MDINRIIQDLLIKNNSVSVAGLGTFSLNYIAAEVYKLSNQVSPPSYQLVFTENFDSSDNSIITILSKENNISLIEAKEALDKWVKVVNSVLERGSFYLIMEVGILKKVNNKTVFEPAKNSILYADNFGLEMTRMPLIEIEGDVTKENTPIKTIYMPQPVKKTKWVNGVLIAVAIIIIGLGIYLLLQLGYLQLGIGKVLAFFKAKNETSTTQLATNDTLSGKIDANDLKRNALLYNENNGTGNSLTNQQSAQKVIKYYLIAGSFRKMNTAEILKNELQSKGFTPEILSINDSIYRVSLASFTNRHKAVEEYIMLTAKEFNNKLWLYSQLTSE
jgi:nucleoid DNA-binding protein